MPIRGKILNCLKADYARIFKSDVIVDLIKVMGCGVELGGRNPSTTGLFTTTSKWCNNIISSSAPMPMWTTTHPHPCADHAHPPYPTLINKGYVYIAESPLYEITTKDRTYFAYTEPEKAAFLEKIGDKNTPSSAPKAWARTTPR